MAGYPYQQQQGYSPSPYMQPSSAGNPASSYSSQGGAQAGPWGTQAPSPQYNAKTSSGYQYNVPGYTPAGQQQRSTQPTAQGGWQWPSQQPQQGYQYQPQPQGGGNPASQIAGWYQQYLGRTPSAGEVQSYMQGGSLADAQRGLQNSQEAQAYRARQQQPQPQQPYGPPQGGGYAVPQGGDPYMAWLQQIMQPYGQGGQGGVFPGGQPPPQGANTDGYPTPQVTQAPLANAMPGWDNTKWNDPNHQTPKYVVGRILQGIPPRTDQMDIAVARLAAAYPGARRVGLGDVSIPGVGTVDILQSAGAGGKAWQWGGGNSAQKFSGGPPAGAGGATDPFQSMLAMLMGSQPPGAMQSLQQQPAVDPAAAKKAADAAAAQKLADQRAATAAAEAKAAQGPGGYHPSFAYY